MTPALRSLRPLIMIVGFLAVCLTSGLSEARDIPMADVRRLMELPVSSILQNSPVSRLNALASLEAVRASSRPAVLLVYRSHDQRSRELATLIRYLALEFRHRVDFFALEIPEATSTEEDFAAKTQQALCLEKVPATLFYRNEETGEGSKSLASPSLKEYRSPGHLFWKTCYAAAVRYLDQCF